MLYLFTVVPKNEKRRERTKKRSKWLRLRKSVSISPEMTSQEPKKNSVDLNYLMKFSYSDYRNCQCNNIVNYLFWTLHQHMEKSRKL